MDAGLPLLRGFIRVGGKPIALRQLEIALHSGCERVICLVSSPDRDLADLQYAAENSGVLFHAISGPQELSGLVAAHDELIVFYEGLLADFKRAGQMLESGLAVFVQTIDTGLAAGFERVDMNYASAGLLRISGKFVEGLAQLPADCDVPSSLTRIALQGGVPMQELTAEARGGMRWQMIANETNAYAIEQDWLAEQLGNPRMVSPGRCIARQSVMLFGSSMLHAGNASVMMIIAMIVSMVVGLGFAWLDLLTGAFAFCSLAWIFHRSALLLQRIERSLAAGARKSLVVRFLSWGLDAELIALMAMASSGFIEGSLIFQIFAPTMLILLIRIVPQLRSQGASAWLSDRFVLCLLLALVAAFGGMIWVVMLAAVALGMAAIAITRDRSG